MVTNKSRETPSAETIMTQIRGVPQPRLAVLFEVRLEEFGVDTLVNLRDVAASGSKTRANAVYAIRPSLGRMRDQIVFR